MSSINLPEIPSSVVDSYDAEYPTRNTEILSYYLLQVFGELSTGGVAVGVNDDTSEDVQTAVDTWLGNWATWLEETTTAVSVWLLEPEESRALPVLVAAPALPAIATAAGVLTGGVVIKIFTDITSNIIGIISQVQAARRQIDAARQFDKAFFDDGWFSAPTPKMDRLIDMLQSSGLSGFTLNEEKSNLQMILEQMDKEQMIKVLTHIVVNSRGEIDGVDFGIPEDFGVSP